LGYTAMSGFAGLSSGAWHAGNVYGGGFPGADSNNNNFSGGGGGYGANAPANSRGQAGGQAYGNAQLSLLFPGGGGGPGGYCENCGTQYGGAGGKGGGIIYILAHTITSTNGILSSNGGSGLNNGGASGAGGSIRLEGMNITLGTTTVSGGTSSSGNGAVGRIAVYYQTAFTAGFTPGYVEQVNPNATATPTATATSVPGFDANVVSLLHMDGADASTSFVDLTGKTWTASGNVQVDTAQKIFGSASGLFDGTGDYISTSNHTDFDFGGGDFTIDARVRLNSLATTQTIISKRAAGVYGPMLLRYNGTNGKWEFYSSQNGTTWGVILSGGSAVVNTWYHIAAVRNGNVWTLYINGASVSTVTASGSVSTNTNNIVIGAADTTGTAANFNGWIDEVRISKGIARWTSNFTPPTMPYYGNNASPTITPTAGWVHKSYDYAGTQIASTPYAQPHAVTAVRDENDVTLGEYLYDQNGNMTCRVEEGKTYKQTYNAENRIASIMKLRSGACGDVNLVLETKWDFAYDGDGTRMATLITPYDETTGLPLTPSYTSYYFGGAYEIRSDGAIFKYYNFQGQSIVNEYDPIEDEWKLSYLLTDHLSSVVAVTDASGALLSQQRYLPFGGERTNIGAISQTDYGYTGQRDLDMGLIDYKFRFYSPLLGRFILPDTMTPGGPQGLNRYSYVNNNPVNFNDPTGHMRVNDDGGGSQLPPPIPDPEDKDDKNDVPTGTPTIPPKVPSSIPTAPPVETPTPLPPPVSPVEPETNCDSVIEYGRLKINCSWEDEELLVGVVSPDNNFYDFEYGVLDKLQGSQWILNYGVGKIPGVGEPAGVIMDQLGFEPLGYDEFRKELDKQQTIEIGKGNSLTVSYDSRFSTHNAGFFTGSGNLSVCSPSVCFSTPLTNRDAAVANDWFSSTYGP
jgi:RHS repeat-associated protein